MEIIFIDLMSRLRTFYIPKEARDRLYNDGIEVDGYSIDGYSHIEESDVLIKGLREYSSNSLGTVVFARVLKDSNRKHPYDPIYALEKVLEEYKRLKLEVRVGVEPEFYVVKPTENGLIKPADNAGYMDTSESDLVRRIRLQTAEILNDVGVFIEKHHHEVGPGQCEINFKHSDPLSTSMNLLLLKHVVKRVASDHGVQVTFMPKPFYEYPGNGLHVHISLWRDDENLFYDSDYVLSDIGLYFMGGILKYARPLTAFLAQTINSYRRLKLGFEAPVVISWGCYNRSAMIRVPKITCPEGRRVEIRTPDAAVNPFIAFAAILCAGIEGIKKKIDPETYMTSENVYKKSFDDERLLPSSLEEALDLLRKHHHVFTPMGDIVSKFMGIKTEEIESFRRENGTFNPESDITKWELTKYINL